MRRVEDYIKALPTYRIPERYGWDAVEGVSLEDLNFFNICDCVHKQYGNQIEPFPAGFDKKFFNRAQVKKKTLEYVEIDPKFMIMAQRYLDKERLLELNLEGYSKPITLIKVGVYFLVKNGHHRLAVHFIRGRRLILANIHTMEL